MPRGKKTFILNGVRHEVRLSENDSVITVQCFRNARPVGPPFSCSKELEIEFSKHFGLWIRDELVELAERAFKKFEETTKPCRSR